MKKIFVILFSLFSFCSTAQTEEIVHHNIEGIRAFAEAIENLDLPVDDTLFIFDLDGTLTHASDPNLGLPTAPRGDVLTVLQGLAEQGYSFIVSSAWYDTETVEQKVRDLGIEDLLHLTEATTDYGIANLTEGQLVPEMSERAYAKQFCQVCTPRAGSFSFARPKCSCDSKFNIEQDRQNGRLFRTRKQGLLVSVAGRNSNIDVKTNLPYFRQKAFAPMLVFGARKFKHVVVLEDGPASISFLKADINQAAYADGAIVHIFQLPYIAGNVSTADYLEAEDDDSVSSGSYEECDDLLLRSSHESLRQSGGELVLSASN